MKLIRFLRFLLEAALTHFARVDREVEVPPLSLTLCPDGKVRMVATRSFSSERLSSKAAFELKEELCNCLVSQGEETFVEVAYDEFRPIFVRGSYEAIEIVNKLKRDSLELARIKKANQKESEVWLTPKPEMLT